MANWRYQALRRAGRWKEAAALLSTIDEKMEVRENTSYFRALLLAKGVRSREQTLDKTQLQGNQWVTAAYPAANLHLLDGEAKQACAAFREIVETEHWAAFGFIAAEVELVRDRPCR